MVCLILRFQGLGKGEGRGDIMFRLNFNLRIALQFDRYVYCCYETECKDILTHVDLLVSLCYITKALLICAFIHQWPIIDCLFNARGILMALGNSIFSLYFNLGLKLVNQVLQKMSSWKLWLLLFNPPHFYSIPWRD